MDFTKPDRSSTTIRRNRLPALAESSGWRYGAFTALYVAQGFPAGLLTIALPAWLAKQGLGTAEIGSYLAVVGLPWSLKLIAGPLMDRFAFLPMGRRRPWVLAAELGIVASFVALSVLADPASHLYWMMALGFVVNFFTAFQDVATDGLAIQVLPQEQQARANSFMWGGKTSGIAVAAAGGSYLLNEFGFGATTLVMAACVALILLFPLLLRERPGERLLPWTEGAPTESALQSHSADWRDIARNLLRASWLPTSRLTVLGFFCFTVSEGISDTVLPVLTVQQLGWHDMDYSQLMGTARIAAAIAGVLLGAIIIDRLGRIRTMMLSGTLLFATAMSMGLLAHLWTEDTLIKVYVILKETLVVTISIAYLSTCMTLCWQRIAASQFALYMAVANLGGTIGAGITGPLDAVLDYGHLFFVMAAIQLVMLAIFWRVRLENHRFHLEKLEVETA